MFFVVFAQLQNGIIMYYESRYAAPKYKLPGAGISLKAGNLPCTAVASH